jgi:asparagine synthase (glutamine-hydrolysing)
MLNDEETVVVVFNGEIYNHLELRAELETRGHVFRSDHSDTEVLVHGYEEWGTELPIKLNGMFAFAIYDKRRRSIFLVRDRFGEKPLYYACRPGFFAFASEASALTLHPQLDRSLDRRSVQKFFAHGYLPGRNCIFKDCCKLPGGSYLNYRVDTGTLETRRYWHFRLRPNESLTEADDDWLAEELRSLIVQAVKRRLMSDVPLGVFLSGGIDSSAVLAAATHLLGRRRISTFTIGFNEPSFDESGYARSVAQTLEARHNEKKLELSSATELLSQVLTKMDEPLADPSLLPTYLLSKFARQSVTVALSGADELFAGYHTFKALGRAKTYHRLIPARLHDLIRQFTEHLPNSLVKIKVVANARSIIPALSYAPSIWNVAWLAPLNPHDIVEIFDDPLPLEELYEDVIDAWNASESNDIEDRTLEYFTNFYLQDDILTKVDRAAMMNSLETRAVFLDNDLVDFCARLPYRFKRRNGQGKYLLRRALRGMVPEEVFTRRKMGFGIPLADWLSSMRPESRSTTPIPGFRSVLAEEWSRQYRSGAPGHPLFLWGWLALQGVIQ